MKRSVALLVTSLSAIAALFAVAGTAAWWNAWVFLLFMAVIGLFTARLFRDSPGLAEERRTAAHKAEPWDRMLVRLVNLALPVMVLLSACEKRFHWLPSLPTGVSISAFIVMVPAAVLTYRAMAANDFFSSHVRIQADRGHVVVSSGPYSVVRHPGYAGSAAFNLLIPPALGSWAAMVIAIGTVALLVWRTGKEDRMLLAALPGYEAYAAQVRSRLIPMVW